MCNKILALRMIGCITLNGKQLHKVLQPIQRRLLWKIGDSYNIVFFVGRGQLSAMSEISYICFDILLNKKLRGLSRSLICKLR